MCVVGGLMNNLLIIFLFATLFGVIVERILDFIIGGTK